MGASRYGRHALAAGVLLVLAAAQLFVLVKRLEPFGGPWILYGRDTIFHDAIVQIWVQQQLDTAPGTVPLWMPGLQGGLPTVGAFLWTPLAPAVAPFLAFPFPHAQRLAWLVALWAAGLCAYAAGRALRLRTMPALIGAAAWMLCGHVVTLIHAGHFQKVVALGWLPLMVAGALWSACAGHRRVQALGVATGALGLGMMFLGGHPQIAYLGMLTAGALTAVRMVRRRWRRVAPGMTMRFAAMMGAGMLLGGAQFLPGLEMGALSNRAAGVSFAEATETSYPPGEVAEFLVPRVKGSSVFGDEYHGEWGERIVSDYFGRGGFALALIGLAAAVRRGPRRREAIFLGAAAVFWLVVGLGRHTPLYGLLWNTLPGLRSFRSPGTFMAGTSLALALLAGVGAQALAELVQRRGRALAAPLLAVLLVGHSADVGMANRHFLYAWSWDRYQADFLAPRELDLWLTENHRGLTTHDVATELNLRPLLFGATALNGYHPIVYAAKEAQDRALGFNTRAWFAAWGVTTVLLRPTDEPAEGLKAVAVFPDSGRQAVELPGIPPPVRTATGEAVQHRWLSRSANERRLEVSLAAPARIEVAEIAGPGMEISLDGKVLRVVEEPELRTLLELSGGTQTVAWRYRPFSWALGVYLTALGAAAVALGLSGARRRRLAAP